METEATFTADAATATVISDTARLVTLDQFCPSNAYTTRKTVAMGCLVFALLMANASQLIAVVDIPSDMRDNFYVPMIVLIAISIVLQVSLGVVLVILGVVNPTTESSVSRTKTLNDSSVILSIFLTAVNVFIAACGISYVHWKEETINTTTVQPSVTTLSW